MPLNRRMAPRRASSRNGTAGASTPTPRRVSGPALLLGALAAGLSLVFLRAEITSLPLTRTAEALESAEALPRITPASRAVLERFVPAASGCAPRPLRARLGATLFLLDRDMADGAAPEVRLERFEAAEAAAQAALRCAPLDGRTWAQLASLDLLAAFEPTRYGDLMALSARQAPFEGAAMALRWVSLAQTPDLGERLRDSAMRVDLCRFLSGAAPSDALALLAALDRPETRNALVETLRAVPADRREAMDKRLVAPNAPPSVEPGAAAALLAAAADAPPLPAEACGLDARHPMTPVPLVPVRFLQTGGRAPS